MTALKRMIGNKAKKNSIAGFFKKFTLKMKYTCSTSKVLEVISKRINNLK